MADSYDALLVVAFGGPEGPQEVMPFLANVLRGRNIPRERLLEVAGHYQHFGGKSPINDHIRELIECLRGEFARRGIGLPIYWGNRNWHPFLTDTLRQMRASGIRRALAFFTSPYSSYSSCRQYRENIAAAQAEVGEGAPQVEKLRAYFNHPGFIEAMTNRVAAALSAVPAAGRHATILLFTAHSIPLAMSATCNYVEQLTEACRLVAEGCGVARWRLVYQSRSGPPTQPWLEPDVCDVLREIGGQRQANDVLVAPIGFISDHMEVMYDLDEEAAQVAREQGLNMVRAATVGVHPKFVGMIVDLVEERISGTTQRPVVGNLGPVPDICPPDCCVYTPSRPT